MSLVADALELLRSAQTLIYDDLYTVLTAQTVASMGVTQPDWSLPPEVVLIGAQPLTLKGSRQALSEQTTARAGLTGRSSAYSISCELYDLNPETHRLMDSALNVYRLIEIREAKSHLELIAELT